MHADTDLNMSFVLVVGAIFDLQEEDQLFKYKYYPFSRFSPLENTTLSLGNEKLEKQREG